MTWISLLLEDRKYNYIEIGISRQIRNSKNPDSFFLTI